MRKRSAVSISSALLTGSCVLWLCAMGTGSDGFFRRASAQTQPASSKPEARGAESGGPLLLGWVKSRPDQDAADPVAGCLTLPRRLTLGPEGLRSAVDPVVAEALGGGATSQRVGGGRHTLPAYAVCLLAASGRLASERAADAVLDLVAGTTVYVDADVVEAYPPSGPPVTVRGLGGWSLDLADGTAVVNRLDA